MERLQLILVVLFIALAVYILVQRFGGGSGGDNSCDTNCNCH